MTRNFYNNRGNRGGRDKSPPLELPQGYLINGYFDDKRRPREELYLTWAEDIANNLKSAEMTQSALRNFYNEVKLIQSLIRSEDSAMKEEQFKNHKHRILKLKAMANYFINKPENKPRRSLRLFYEFIEKNLPLAVKDSSHFNVFVDHFMCILGYFKEGRS